RHVGQPRRADRREPLQQPRAGLVDAAAPGRLLGGHERAGDEDRRERQPGRGADRDPAGGGGGGPRPGGAAARPRGRAGRRDGGDGREGGGGGGGGGGDRAGRRPRRLGSVAHGAAPGPSGPAATRPSVRSQAAATAWGARPSSCIRASSDASVAVDRRAD